MTPAEYLTEITHKLSPERATIIEDLIEQKRLARARPKPMPVPSIVHGYGRYASPVLRGKPVMVRIDSEKAKEVLSCCRMYSRQSPLDKDKLNSFITLIQSGQWIADKSAPIMISRNGICLNGRHRLTALSRSTGCSAEMAVLDEMKIIV